MELVPSDNHKVLAFTRSHGEQTVLVVINLSRFAQVAELELAKFAGTVPVEVFSRNRFPSVKDAPYVLTLGIHDYFWFALEREAEAAAAGGERVFPELSVRKDWTGVLAGKARERFEEQALPSYLSLVRWFGGKGRALQRARVLDAVPLDRSETAARILLLEVSYTEGPPETYVLPIAFAAGGRAEQVLTESPQGVIARLEAEGVQGVLFDAVYDEGFRASLLALISGRRKVRSRLGEISGFPGRRLRNMLVGRAASPASRALKAEQSNTSIVYEDALFFKLYRKPDEGPNPDAEISRFLTEHTACACAPSFAGGLEYRRPGSEPMVIGLLQGFVPNEGDAWTYTLDVMRQFIERVMSEPVAPQDIPRLPQSLLDTNPSALPPKLQELIGSMYLDAVALLGRRTGELHKALASAAGEPAFEPEPFTQLYQRSVYQSMRNLAKRTLQLLQKNLKKLPEPVRPAAAAVLKLEEDVLKVFRTIIETRIIAAKIRYHGDLHLGQVLRTGKDFIIIDFEGEPARTLSERRLKRSPLRDVAGMIRSFHYAAHSALMAHGSVRPEDSIRLEAWTEAWYGAVSGVFLNSYLFETQGESFIPQGRKEFETLLRCFLLEKAVYELGYELNNRPDQVIIPLRGIERLLKRA
jgi:maltose alpha-D-glucosyltransferase/alpha-amylase